MPSQSGWTVMCAGPDKIVILGSNIDKVAVSAYSSADFFVDGTTIQGAGTMNNPLKADFSKNFYFDYNTLEGDGTIYNQLRVKSILPIYSPGDVPAIGAWYDGKKIYRRMVQGTLTADANIHLHTGINIQVDKLLNVIGEFNDGNDFRWQIGHYFENAKKSSVHVNQNGYPQLTTTSNYDRTNAPYYLILEYTKPE
jgi:hypothetical protein